VALAACTGERVIEFTTETPPTPTPSPAPTVVADLSGVPGRLALLDDLGTLVTVRADGSDEVVLGESVQGEVLIRQPTWSPDGGRIAWVRFDAGGRGPNAVVTSAPDGRRPTETSTSVIPFYLSWDPTSSRIAYLGSSSTGDIELGIVDPAGGRATALDAGTPFYVSWGPSGEQLLAHVGADRIDRLGIDGSISPVDDRPGSFSAPVWTSDGASLVYASAADDGQRLIAHDPEADRANELVEFEGAITFVVSPDGRRVAFQVVRGPGDVGPLSVLDRETGTIEPVTPGYVPAYFWSPDGDRLLHLLTETPSDGRVWFRWGVWQDGSSFATARFVPTEVFTRDYLQFFEQYAQSMHLWAPDGSAFTYAGSNESGQTGVWVQVAREGVEPVLVSDGVFAAWSPAD
jgi:Tol biopolymer transport system component